MNSANALVPLSPAAFVAILACAQEPILYYSFGLVYPDLGDAEDATQEVFVAAWTASQAGRAPFLVERSTNQRIERITTFADVPSAMCRWLFGVARKKAIDVRRKRSRRPAQYGLQVDYPDTDPSGAVRLFDEELAHGEIADEDLHRALRRLSVKLRVCLFLRVVGDLSVQQVADALNISEAAAEKRVGRALKTLRTTLNGSSIQVRHRKLTIKGKSQHE